jgi:hypothetical protein
VESPVPVDEIRVVELDGRDELIVDGDLMLMWLSRVAGRATPVGPGAAQCGCGVARAGLCIFGRGTVRSLDIRGS